MNLQVRFRYKLLAIIGLWIWFLYFVMGIFHPKPNVPAILLKNDTEQITVDPSKHRITIVTPLGSKVETLPDRPSIFDVHKDGTVTITSKQFGFETKPFIGVGFGEGMRVYAGADLGYFKRLDLGLGLTSPKLNKGDITDIRGLVKVSYNFYSNTSINLGSDTSKTIHCFVSVRL